MQASVDGYVGRESEGPSWQVWDWGEDCPWDRPLQDRFNEFFAAADTILLSRKIIEGGYLDHWTQLAGLHPDEPLFAFARRIVQARNVVFSNSLAETPWPGTELATGTLPDTISELKSQPGKNIVAFGGAGFASALIAAGVVDEVEFYTNPVALGDGLRIFPEAKGNQALQLESSTAYKCGIVVTDYSIS
jgi:dihydrofolate reductase